MKLLFRIALRNVTLHWRHSIASLLSIMAAFLSLNVFQGYIQDLEHLYYVSYRHRSMYGDLLVMHRDSETPDARAEPWKFGLTPPMQEAIRSFASSRADAISATARFLELSGTVSNGATSTIFISLAYDDREASKLRGDLWKWNTLYGEPMFLHPEGGRVLIGQALGRILGCLPDPPVRALVFEGGYEPKNRPYQCKTSSLQISATTDSGQINALDLNVAGLIDAGYSDIDRRYLNLSLKDAQTLLNTDRVSNIALLLNNPSDAARIQREFEQDVRSKIPELSILRWQDHPRIGDLYNRTMELLSIFRNFVVAVIISISALSVLNTMTKSLTERTREIGTLLSLGFRGRHIRAIFVSESLLLGLFGIAMGICSSSVIAFAINHAGIFYKAGMLSEPVPFRIALNLPIMLLSAAGLLALTVLATLAATGRVLQKRIIECLQHV